jgi:hypothetical protein
MRGRYRLSRRKQIIEEHFDTADWQDDWSPRYNIAPTQLIPVIRQHPTARQVSLMKWGLIQSWAESRSGAAGMINARSETAEFSKHRSLFAHARIGWLGHTRGRPLKEIAISFAKTSLRSMSRLVVASEAGYGEHWRGATSANSCLFRFGTPSWGPKTLPFD